MIYAACAVTVAIAMVLLWLLSLWRRDSSSVDIFWGAGFALQALVAFGLGGGHALAAALTVIWGARLCAYLWWRNSGKGEDFRYVRMREHHGDRYWWVSLFTVFLFQGALLVVIAMPVVAAQMASTTLGTLGFVGAGMWLLGFSFESVGDWQLARFKADPANAGAVMDTGLWRYTRHPNYFGDACVWWGLYLIAADAGAWWTLFSPLLMTFFLLRVSGVALLEKTIGERRPAYAAYVRRTSAFIPWPPRR